MYCVNTFRENKFKKTT